MKEEIEAVIIVVEWEETPTSEQRSEVPGHEHHRHEVHVRDEREGKTYLVHGRDGTHVRTIIEKFYAKLGSARAPYDHLWCDGAKHDDVYALEGLTLGEFHRDGHSFRWQFERVEFTIIVNGRDKTVHERKLSYDGVVRLAYADPFKDPNILYKVTYRKGPHANPDGVLVADQSVQIKGGMVFVVTPTNES